MTTPPQTNASLFDAAGSAALYDRSINWAARLGREIPVLSDAFGAPGGGRILDAGCGPGRQALGLAERGYHVVGVDLSDAPLELAVRRAKDSAGSTEFVRASYAELHDKLGGGFDGVYCIGNSLAASGTQSAAREAIHQFGLCLRTGGRLFVQILNFEPMRRELPCVRGPRVVSVDGVEYISTRQFHFAQGQVQVTNVTLWHDDGWRQACHLGCLYPISLDEIGTWCDESGLRVDAVHGGYDGSAFDIDRSIDLITVATRR